MIALALWLITAVVCAHFCKKLAIKYQCDVMDAEIIGFVFHVFGLVGYWAFVWFVIGKPKN